MIPKNYNIIANLYRNMKRDQIDKLLLEYDLDRFKKLEKHLINEKRAKKQPAVLTNSERKQLELRCKKSQMKLNKDRVKAKTQWEEIVRAADSIKPFVSRDEYLEGKDGQFVHNVLITGTVDLTTQLPSSPGVSKTSKEKT